MYKDNQERIDAYLRGEMTTEQMNLFENELKVDEELCGEYLLTKAIVKALADRQEKIELMRQWDEESEDDTIYNEDKRLVACIKHDTWEKRGITCSPVPVYDRKPAVVSKPRIRIRRWIFGVSAAACIAMCFVAVKSIFFMSSLPDGDYMMPDFKYESIYRKGNNDIALIDSLISDKEYNRALASVDSLIHDYNETIGIYMAKDTFTERDEYKIKENRDPLYELEWRKIHILLALNKKEEAIQILVLFKDNEGKYKSEAVSLFNTLNIDK